MELSTCINSHLGLSGIQSRSLNIYEIDQVVDLFKNSDVFFKQTAGRKANINDAEELFTSLPPKKTLQDKHVIGLFQDKCCLVGVLDLICNYPEEQVWTIGLFVIQPALRGKNYGRKVITSLEKCLIKKNISTLRCVVDKENLSAQFFWTALDFSFKEETNQKVGNEVRTVKIYSKSL